MEDVALSEAFAKLVETVEHDDRFVGLLLGGSRGKGLGTERSDYGVYVVVADDVDPQAIQFDVDYRDGIDLVGVWPVSAFATYAVGDGNDWNRYNFAHLQPAVDKLGTLQAVSDAKEWLDPAGAHASAALMLDGYLNYRFRAAKNRVDGNLDAVALDVVESVLFMLDFVFTSERRVRPYSKFLAWEFRAHPLELDWGIITQPSTPTQMVRTADSLLQAACFKAVETGARQLGFDSVLDAWRPSELALMRTDI